MEASHGPPDADGFGRWQTQRGWCSSFCACKPDPAFEFLTDAVENQIGVPAAEALPTPQRCWV